MVSKRQYCVPHSTPEPEIVAMHTAVRTVTILMMELWKPLLPGTKSIVFGDNELMRHVVKTGRNPTIRHLGRTHRVSVAWWHEQYKSGSYECAIRWSQEMAADIFTQAFVVGSHWLEVLDLIGITVINDVKGDEVVNGY